MAKMSNVRDSATSDSKRKSRDGSMGRPGPGFIVYSGMGGTSGGRRSGARMGAGKLMPRRFKGR